MKVGVRTEVTSGRTVYWLWCPACDSAVMINDSWGWNGDGEKPTFTPSILVGGIQWNEGDDFYKSSHRVMPGEPITCHSFLTDGVWHFLDDCTHEHAGQEMPAVDLPPWLLE